MRYLISFLLLIYVNFSIGNKCYEEFYNFDQYQYKTTQSNGHWIAMCDWILTNPKCVNSCISIYYKLFRYSNLDKYGRYQYCYVFQSNSRYTNGAIVNTSFYNFRIMVDNIMLYTNNYLLVGTGIGASKQLSVYFYAEKRYINTNSYISWEAKETKIN